jgi:osmotically-inducible protein OsmY
MYDQAERFHEETDRDLERRVVAFLADRNLPALRRLGVHSQRGVVTLRGRVGTFYEKQLGGQSARRVAGVVDVIDAISVATDPVRPIRPARFPLEPSRNTDPISQLQG